MDLQLSGKTALVTGSTAGIGLAIAQVLAKEGTAVVINGRTQQRVDQALRTIKDQTPKANVRGIVADLGTRAGADKLLAQLPAVDILVNNLGIFEPKPFVEIPDEDWMRFFEVNVMSGVRMSRHYLPAMLSAKWGRIIFISSESGVNIPAEMIHYGMTKTAQIAIARGMAELTRGSAVTVNSVLVGPTRSEGVETFIGQMATGRGIDRAAVEKDFFATVRPSSLVKRFLDTAEIAQVVAFVASPLAAAINGSALRAEGGTVQTAL